MSYQKKLLRQLDQLQPGTLNFARVLHDDYCSMLRDQNKDCDCQPDIEFYDEEGGLKHQLAKHQKVRGATAMTPNEAPGK
jgi:hypothetical protein